MIYYKVELRERNYSALLTEIIFNVASMKAVSAELVRFDIKKPQDKNDSKAYPAAMRIMKYAKKRGIIQIYVNDEILSKNTTEALYIKNLYGDFIDGEIRPDGYDFIYVRI